MAKVGKRPLDDQILEGGSMGAGVGGTKWSNLPSFKGKANAVDDIKKMGADTSHLKGGAKSAADEAKDRAFNRTAARAAGVAAVNEGVKAALNNTVSAKESDTDEDRSFKEMSRAMRAADADIASESYGKGDKSYKRGGKVNSASSRADGIASKGKTKGRMV
jgi:hypothetical protein